MVTFSDLAQLVGLIADVRSFEDLKQKLEGLEPLDVYVAAFCDVLATEEEFLAAKGKPFAFHPEPFRQRLRGAGIEPRELSLAAKSLTDQIGERVAGLLLDPEVLTGLDLGVDVDGGWSQRLVEAAHQRYSRELLGRLPEGQAEWLALQNIAATQHDQHAAVMAKLEELAVLQKQDAQPPSLILAPSIPAPAENPFVAGGAVPPELFVGRGSALAFIRQRLGGKTLQSVSLVGERRIGKSSLLRYVKERADVLFKPRPVVVYLDLMKGYCHTRTGFTKALRRELTAGLGREPWTPPEDANPSTLSFALEDLSRAGVRLVLCLDEVEDLTKRRAEFDDVLEELRAAGQLGQLGLLTASRQPLADLCRSGGLTSPFYTIFLQENLGLLAEAEWRQLVTDRLAVTADELQAIERLAGGHPHYTQLAASRLWQSRVDGNLNWAERALDDMRPLWADQWQHLPPVEQTALKAVALDYPGPTPEIVAASLRRRGLLRGRQPFSAAYAEWLSTR